jgi:hypothetical protein
VRSAKSLRTPVYELRATQQVVADSVGATIAIVQLPVQAVTQQRI